MVFSPDRLEPATATPRHAACATCSSLRDEEYGCQKYGWPDDDRSLPEAAGRLVLVKDLRPGSGRLLLLERCPECATHYLYRTDYEFLVNGSEDEQFLTRLNDAEAAELLNGPAAG